MASYFSMIRACTDEEIDGPPNPLPHISCLGDQSNLPSPVVSCHLPPELLASIFIHIARDSYIDQKYSYPAVTRPDWVNVSYVCRYWRDVALNCPTLWSYIPAMSRRWTEELLARSQMAPLKISANVFTTGHHYFRAREEQKARVLPIVEQVMNHSQRIQKLRVNTGVASEETSYQILSKFFSRRIPCLQHLEISQFSLPGGKSWFPFEEYTPALHTLTLKQCSLPWYSLGPGVLTTLHLSFFGLCNQDNTTADFLAMLRRMPHLVHLYLYGTLSSYHGFVFTGELNTTPMVDLPHLSNLLITTVPVSVATALLSCVDIPLKAKVRLEVWPDDTSECTSTLDDYVRLTSLLGQRTTQSDSPKFRSLTIGSPKEIALAFSTSERVESYSPDSLFSSTSDDNALFKVNFTCDCRMDELDYPVLSGICSAIPMTNIQSVHFLGPDLEPEFWRDMSASLSDVRRIKFSHGTMPNITSMFSLSSHDLTRSWQDGHADRGQGEIFVPALEELELYQVTLKRNHGRMYPDPYVADVQALYDAISTRKVTRCRLIIKECRLLIDGDTKALESVGWWEGDQFAVTSNV